MHHNSALRIAQSFEKFLPMQDVSLFDGWAEVFNAPVQSSAYLEGLSSMWADFERFYFELDLSSASERAKSLYHRASKKIEPFTVFSDLNNHNAGNIKSNTESVDVMFMDTDVTAGLSSSEVNPITLSAITE